MHGQPGRATMDPSTCWHCRKWGSWQIGKRRHKASTTPSRYLVQRGKDTSLQETKATMATNKPRLRSTGRPHQQTGQEKSNHHFPTQNWSLRTQEAPEETGSFGDSLLRVRLRGTNTGTHTTNLPSVWCSTPNFLANRHRPLNQTLGVRYRPTTNCGLHDGHRNKNLGHVNVLNAEEEEEVFGYQKHFSDFLRLSPFVH